MSSRLPESVVGCIDSVSGWDPDEKTSYGVCSTYQGVPMEVRCEAESCMERLRGSAPNLRVLIEIVHTDYIDREIIKENEKGAAAAERVRKIQNGEQGADMMEFNQAAQRLQRFITAANHLSYIHESSSDPEQKVVKLSDVRRLLCNLADGQEPDYIPPPAWVGKDCVGYLVQRGWKLTDDHAGLHRRGYFISAEAIEHFGHVGGPESTADMLEIEKSWRTANPDNGEDQ